MPRKCRRPRGLSCEGARRPARAYLQRDGERGRWHGATAGPSRGRRAVGTYFVVVWGSGFVASRYALQYAAPFTYIGVRYGFALVVALLAFGLRARWPRTGAGWGQAAVAGLLSHAGYLGGSHYAQRWGLSAGITALVLALQPLLTAVVVSRWLHERLAFWQKVGVGVGLAGVALVVGPRAVTGAASVASLLAVAWALVCVTSGTLYQRQFGATTDLRSAVCIHFAATAALMLPLAVAVEGFAIEWSAPIAGGALVPCGPRLDRRLTRSCTC